MGNYRFWIRAFILAAAVQAGWADAPDAGERRDVSEDQQTDTVLHSTTRRFLAVGPDAAECLQVLLFTEDVASRIERVLGRSIPSERGNPLRIRMARDAATGGEAMVARLRTRSGMQMVQRILVVHPDRSDPEEFLEALTAELLDRLVWEKRPPVRQGEPTPAAPGWIAAGLAQDLFPALRARNHALLRRYAAQGDLPPLAIAIEAPDTATPHTLSRALRGAVFGWIRAQPRFTAAFEAWTRAWAQGHTPDLPSMLGDAGLASLSSGALEREWNLWLAAQRSVLRSWGSPDPADFSDLRERLRIPALAIDGAHPSDGRWVTPESVLRHRDEPWAREGAASLRRGLLRLNSGTRGEDFHGVARAFVDLLAAVEHPRAGRWRRRTGTAELADRLHEARRQLDALEESVRRQSLAENEPAHAGYLGRPATEAARDMLRRTLDAWEREDARTTDGNGG